MKYKLFITDYDGTLGHAPENTIDSEVLTAINEFKAKGGKFVICTGRMFGSIKMICDKVHLEGIVVAYQGGVIKNTKTGETFFDGGLSPEVTVKVVEEMRKQNILICLYINDKLYYEENVNNHRYIEEYERLLDTTAILVDDLCVEVLKQGKNTGKICGLCPEAEVSSYVEKIKKGLENEAVLVNSGARFLVECIHRDHHKGNAVKFLSEYFNIPFDQIITVGDSTNDIGLVDGPWHGVAVGDAKQALKDVAKEITVPYSEKPVLYLLKKYCLED